MFNANEKKWEKLLEHEKLGKITDPYKRAVTTVLLENQEAQNKADGTNGYATIDRNDLQEAAPANASGAFPNATNLKGYDPVLISLVRRAMPNLMAFDICGVQPMKAPTGLIFAMKSRYSTQGGDEALFNEADTAFSGTGISAKTRALKAEYTMEIAQDLKAVHGLDAETELANILSAEILAEINREVVRTILTNAVTGAAKTSSAGTFDLDVDSNGRWSVEKYKGLMTHIEFDANAIAKATRRGRGNILITTSDVASALSMTGLLDSAPALKDNLAVDDTGNTFVGVLNNRFKVYIDPFAGTTYDWYVVGYKGSNAYDAGLFYCPYVPLQMVRAVGENSFQPKIGFKTRYGIVANPFATSAGDGALGDSTNIYYRRALVTNLI